MNLWFQNYVRTYYNWGGGMVILLLTQHKYNL